MTTEQNAIVLGYTRVEHHLATQSMRYIHDIIKPANQPSLSLSLSLSLHLLCCFCVCLWEVQSIWNVKYEVAVL